MPERRSSKWGDAELEAVRLDERARIRRELGALIEKTGHDLDQAVLGAAKEERARIRRELNSVIASIGDYKGKPVARSALEGWARAIEEATR